MTLEVGSGVLVPLVHSTINTPRRYYLLMRIAQRELQAPTEPAWQAKQEEQPGTLLPEAFPLRAKLAVPGYITYADLNGADIQELRQNAKLTPYEAELVLNELKLYGNPDA